MTINSFKLTTEKTDSGIIARIFNTSTEQIAEKEFLKGTPLRNLITWSDSQMKQQVLKHI